MNNHIFTYSHKFFEYLTELYRADTSVTVDVASFGMYLGITSETDWHKKKYPVDARYFIEDINRNNLRMIIGVPTLIHCVKPFCNHCVDAYNKRLMNFAATQEKLHLPITYIKNSHLKMYRIGDRYFSGGINLTNSTFVDASFEIIDKAIQKELQDTFEMLWKFQNTDPSIFQAIRFNEGEEENDVELSF